MRKFYVFQEDLIKYEAEDNITISNFVKNLNLMYKVDGMRKLRVEEIIFFLEKRHFLERDNVGKLCPTKKGSILGIHQEIRQSNEGDSFRVNLLSKRAVTYLLDNL